MTTEEPAKTKFVNEQCAVLTYTGDLRAIAWREYLQNRWKTFQGELPEIKLLIICGVHGGEDGNYYGDAYNVETCKLQVEKLKENVEISWIAEVLDLKMYYHNDKEIIDETKLANKVKLFKPHLVLFSICNSQVSKVKTILEKEGVLPEIRLRRNLIASTNQRLIELDEKQVNFIYEVTKPENINKNVVIQGPEGSGKTLLGIEIVKILVSNYVFTENISPENIKKDIRVVLSATHYDFNKPEEVDVWKTQVNLNHHMKSLYEVEVEEVKARNMVRNPNDYNGDPNLILDIIKKNNSYGNFKKTFIMIDELNPGFESSDWETYKNFQCSGVNDVQIVFNLKYGFHDMKIRNDRNKNDTRDYNEIDIQKFQDVLVGRLYKAHRCSNEIRNFVYYLLMHQFDDDEVHKFKSFHHDEPSFDGKKPIWIGTSETALFKDWVRHHLRQLLSGKTVALIYDPDTIEESIKPICVTEKWKSYPMTEIVGTEFPVVIIYGLKNFHFEAFTRAVSQLIIVTTSASSGKLTTALNNMKNDNHQDDVCKLNCKKNGKYFKQENPYVCKFGRTTESTEKQYPKSLMECPEWNPEWDVSNDAENPSKPTESNFYKWLKLLGLVLFVLFVLLVLVVSIIIVIHTCTVEGECPFGSVTIFKCPTVNFIIVATGLLYESGRHTEIVDLNNPDFHCTGLSDFPISVAYAAGGIVNGIPIICGGANSTFDRSVINNEKSEKIHTVSKDCYAFDFEERKWTKKKSLELDVPKFDLGTGSLTINDELLIHGGKKDGHSFINDDYRLANGALTVSGHCNLLINRTHFMMMGGTIPDKYQGKTVTEKTFKCNVDSKSCTPGPPLNHPRKAHGCYKRTFQGKQQLNVIGGFKDEHRIESISDVETLVLGEEVERWKMDHDKLNNNIRGHTMIRTTTVTDEEEIYLIGGFATSTFIKGQKDIHKLSKDGKSFDPWKTSLRYGRAYHIALPISYEHAKKSCKSWRAYNAAAESSSITCDDGWKSIHGKCYKVVTETKSWEEAKNYCKDLNGKLAEPQNRSENELLYDYLQSESGSYPPPQGPPAWIGINDINSEGKFVFDSNNNEVPYEYWQSGEPNNKGGKENCVFIDDTNTEKLGAWNDNECNLRIQSICEL